MKVNAEPVAEPSFIDATAAEGSHTYVVTVVYDKGESKASNAVVVEVTTGINTISGKNIIVASGKRFIGLTNAEGMDVIITNADGRTVFNGNVENSATISVAPGTYIVKVGNTIVKALVK